MNASETLTTPALEGLRVKITNARELLASGRTMAALDALEEVEAIVVEALDRSEPEGEQVVVIATPGTDAPGAGFVADENGVGPVGVAGERVGDFVRVDFDGLQQLVNERCLAAV